jgi:hypothetical protein
MTLLSTGVSAGLLDGFVEADPTIAAILVGAIVVAAVAFVVIRVRAARRGR